MSKRIIYFLAVVFSLSLLTFPACSDDDDDVVELMLEKNSVTVAAGSEITVKITNGNGGYRVESDNTDTATVKVDNNVVTITGVEKGKTHILVSDKEGKYATINVNVTADLIPDAAGTYEGELTIEMEGVDPMDQAIIIESSSESKNLIKVSLNNFTFMGFNLGNIIVNNIPLTKDGDTYKLAATTETVNLTMGGAPISAKATVSGTIKSGKLNLTINVTEVPAIGQIAVSFEGDKNTAG